MHFCMKYFSGICGLAWLSHVADGWRHTARLAAGSTAVFALRSNRPGHVEHWLAGLEELIALFVVWIFWSSSRCTLLQHNLQNEVWTWDIFLMAVSDWIGVDGCSCSHSRCHLSVCLFPHQLRHLGRCVRYAWLSFLRFSTLIDSRCEFFVHQMLCTRSTKLVSNIRYQHPWVNQLCLCKRPRCLDRTLFLLWRLKISFETLMMMSWLLKWAKLMFIFQLWRLFS